MNNIYDWLYEHYYKPRAADIMAACGDLNALAEDAMQVLLAEGSSELDTLDAIQNVKAANGTAAFAAGVYFGCHLMLDLNLNDTARFCGVIGV